MFFLDPHSDAWFEIIGENESVVASFASTTGAAFNRYYGEHPYSNVGYAIGSCNLGNRTDPAFIIGQVEPSGDAMAPDLVIRGHNVGFGTRSPGTDRIRVEGDARVTGTLTTENLVVLSASSGLSYSDQLVVENSGTDVAAIVRQLGTNSVAEFYKNQDLALVIRQDGNVGIGTTNPRHQLEVAQRARLNSVQTSLLVADTPTSGDGNMVTAGGINVGGGIVATSLDVYGGAAVTLTVDPGEQAKITNVAYAPNNLRFRVTGEGNVGIGVEDPVARLQVQGNVLPSEDATHNLGSNAIRWGSLFLSSNLDIAGAVLSNVSGALATTDLRANNATIQTSLTHTGLTASRALIIDANQRIAASAVTSTELGRLSGVTSAVQTQLNNRLALTGGTLTGRLTINSGTAGGPGLSVSQTNAAIASFFDPEVSATVPVFHIADGGNVGVGTATPTHKLHIYASNATNNDYESAGILLQNAGLGETGLAFHTQAMGTNAWVLGINSNQTRLDIAYGTQSSQMDDASVDLTILGTGSVGIGRTDPGALLDVAGGIRAMSSIRLSNVAGYMSGIDATGNQLDLINAATGNVRILYNSTNGDRLIFRETSKGAESVFDTNGNLGVGTGAPLQRLHVAENVLVGKAANGTATASSNQGGPLHRQGGWTAQGGTHTIAFPTYCMGDNSAGTLHIQVSNKSLAATSKVANITLSFIKRATQPVDLFLISTHKSSTLITCTVVAQSNSDITVTTDSDCYVAWTSIGAF
jgi:hypothetical protein